MELRSLSLLLALSSCGQTAVPHENAPALVQAAEPNDSGANPLPDLKPAPLTTWRGEVREKLSAGPYTYLHVDSPDGAAWVVTIEQDVEAGDIVDLRSFGMRDDFHSQRLNRSFETLVFAAVTPVR